MPPASPWTTKLVPILIGIILFTVGGWWIAGLFRPRLISFSVSQETPAAVGRVQVVGQFAYRQLDRAGLDVAGQAEYQSMSDQLKNVGGVDLVESDAQMGAIQNNFQYLRVVRVELSEPANINQVKSILETAGTQILQTLYFPADSQAATADLYQQLNQQARAKAQEIAGGAGLRVGNLVSLNEATSQLKEDSGVLTFMNSEGQLMMVQSKTANVTYSIW